MEQCVRRAGSYYEHPYLKDAPGRIYVYDPRTANTTAARYRFLPDTTTPIGLDDATASAGRRYRSAGKTIASLSSA